MPFKLRPSEFNIIVFTAFCSLTLSLFSAVFFNVERHEIDNLDYNTNITNYNEMVSSVQSLNVSVLTQSEYITQTNNIFFVFFNDTQKNYNDFKNSKNSTSNKLYTASRAVAYCLNGILGIPTLYMFFTATTNMGKNFRAKRKNIIYYRYYWIGISSFFSGLGLIAGSFYSYGRRETQNGVGIFIAGELLIIIGCYILREHVPANYPGGYVDPNEDVGDRSQNLEEGKNNLNKQNQQAPYQHNSQNRIQGEPSAPYQ